MAVVPSQADVSATQAITCGGERATIVGTDKADVLRGTNRVDVIAGLGGNDVIRGLGGDDIICGGQGRDRIFGNGGADELYGELGRDIIRGGSGNDILHGGPANDRLNGGGGNDILQDDEGKRNKHSGGKGFDLCTDLGAAVFNGCESGSQPNPDEGRCGAMTSSLSQESAALALELASQAYAVNRTWRKGDRLDREVDKHGISLSAGVSCWEVLEILDEPSSDTQAYIARNNGTGDLVFSFRGTKGLDDWKTDGKIFKDDWRLPAGDGLIRNSVHTGFKQAYDSVRRKLTKAIKKHELSHVPQARVFFVGHSLGGALANLAALDLADNLEKEGYSPSHIAGYTFGAPRTFTLGLYDEFAKRVVNMHAVANPEDSVVNLLSGISSNRYTHVPNMHLLYEQGGKVRRVLGAGAKFQECPFDSISAGHSRKRYEARIDAIGTGTAPQIGLDRVLGNMRITWSATEGQCDWVALYHSPSGPPEDALDNLEGGIANRDGRRRVRPDLNDEYLTTYDQGSNYWAGYVNAFGEFEAVTTWERVQPAVWASCDPGFLFGKDNVQLNWSETTKNNAFLTDRVVLFDRDPGDVGDANPNIDRDDYIRSAIPTTNSPDKTSVNTDRSSTWWVAYIERSGEGPDLLLDVHEWEARTC